MTAQPIYVDHELFLGRLDEQERFREALHAVLASQAESAAPFIFLMHGEGGMGKSQLTRRLYDIAASDPPFRRNFYPLRIDWELVRNNTPALRVAREQIRPGEVLAALYRAALEQGWDKYFEAYQKVIEQRVQAEQEIAKALEQQKEQGQYTLIRDLGPTGLAKLVRLTGPDLSKALLAAGLPMGAEQAAKAREQAEQFLKARLTPELYNIYCRPHEQLARALGEGLRRVSRDQPLVLLLDTYEIVALAADLWLRLVIKTAGPRLIWVLAGRDNLAPSRPTERYVGYSAEFTRRLTVWDLQELTIQYVAEYVAERAPNRSPTLEEATALHRATLGVPLALHQAADLWVLGVPLEAIIADIPDYTSREELVRLMTERVLLHVEQHEQGLADRYALFTLAMQPRPDPILQSELFRPGPRLFDLNAYLADLAQRYSVVRLAGGARLHDAMGTFIREYLLRVGGSGGDLIQLIAGRAVEVLRVQRAELEQNLFDLAERMESEDWQQATLDLVHWLFWLDEQTAWRELVPRLVEGLGYQLDIAHSLLAVADRFKLKLSSDGRKRLKKLQLDDDNREAMLTELERLAHKGRWLEDQDAEATAERHAILLLWRGQWQVRQGLLNEAGQTYMAAEKYLSAPAINLQKQLGQAFTDLSAKYIWPDPSSFSVASEPGLQIAQRAVTLDPTNKRALMNLGMALNALKRKEEALVVFQQAIRLDPEYASAWHGRGLALRGQRRYQEALTAFQQATALDPKLSSSWLQLGSTYAVLGHIEAGIAAYQRTMELAPWLAPRCWQELGRIHRDSGRNKEAISAFQQAIGLDPKAGFAYGMLGALYELEGDLEEALRFYQRAIEITPDKATGYSSYASVLRKLGRDAEAAGYLARARELTGDENAYDKACLEAIAGNTELAFEYLTQALAEIPYWRKWARRDPDLASLHGHPRFEALIGNED